MLDGVMYSVLKGLLYAKVSHKLRCLPFNIGSPQRSPVPVNEFKKILQLSFNLS